jgi:hypothetical protein
MRVCVNFPPQARDVRLDLIRGTANWAIFLDHIPHEVLSSITTKNYGFSDAADLFVFISGYTAALVFGRITIERGYAAAASSLLRRAVKLYAAHIILVVIYVAVIAGASRALHDPDDLNQFNVGIFMSEPLWQLGQALALKYKPVNLDVLPLYVVLLGAFAPALWLMVRRPTLVLLCSIAVYLAARHFEWNLPASPSGFWYFNPFTWQVLFFLGAWIALGGAEAIHSIVHARTVFWLAVAYLVFALLVTMVNHRPDLGTLLPHWVVRPFDPNDKTNLAPYRVVHLLALAVVAMRFLHADSPVLRWHSLTPLVNCGQQSLQVFCIGIVLSFCAHAVIELSLNSPMVQVLAGVAGVLLMTAAACFLATSKTVI